MRHLLGAPPLLSALAISSCAMRSQVTNMAIKYNEFVTQPANRQTAINVLRASVREPLHFTSFSKVFGTTRVEGTDGLSGAFNGNSGPADKADKQPVFVRFDFRGDDYVVPLSGAKIAETAGHSSQIVGLVQKMLNLHFSLRDLPSTPLVRVFS